SAAFIDGVLDGMWRDVWTINANDIRGFGADDIGIVDYTRIAFWLFGHHVRAFYYLFFIIFGSTVAVALVERRRDPAGQLVIVVVMAVIYALCFYSPVFDNEPAGLGTLTNPRFLSLLAAVPGVHILLLLAESARLAPERLAAVAYQSVVIFFAVNVRSTAAWIPAGLALAALAGAMWTWLLLRGLAFAPRLAAATRPQWPSLVALAVVAAGSFAVAHSLNDVYRREGWLRHHAFWHSVYYSFQFHPLYASPDHEFFAMHDYQTGDFMPFAGIVHYLKQHPEE